MKYLFSKKLYLQKYHTNSYFSLLDLFFLNEREESGDV
jgi:hypothetical protein